MTVRRELWSQARPLFEELVDLNSGERRSRLDEIGKSAPELKDTLESLLRADASDDDPLREYNFGPHGRENSSTKSGVRDPLGIIGKTVSHFRVTGFLAAGGMGVVYTGEDLQLGRTVALKFPAPHEHLTADLKERFVREARAAAALDHPNLCSIHEIADSQYGLFLAMPFYPGETLKERLSREHTVSVADAISLIRQVTTGLASAHAAGIVHRDLKPGNIMLLPDGLVKILDFGLAKIPDTSHTKSRATLGTVAYMAPEQIRSEPADARSDLWAIGVIMYEMLTGVQPFAADHELAIMHGILRDEPRRIGQLNVDSFPAIEQLVTALLQKDRAHRYQTAELLLADLDAADRGVPLAHRLPLWTKAWRRRRIRISAIAACAVVLLLAFGALSWRLGESTRAASLVDPAPPQTLAVLPFVNRDPNSTDEYLVSGLTDGIVSRLSRVRTLRIAGLFSSGALGRQGLSPHAVGERLKARHVIEGGVRVATNTLHTHVLVRRVSDDSVVWSHDFATPLSAIEALEEQVADSIAAVLRVRPPRSTMIAGEASIDAEAYDLYLKARYAWEQRTRQEMEEALAYYRGAVERDPNFALAYSAMAEAYVNMANFGYVPRQKALAVAELASSRAIALDTSLAEAYAVRGQVLSSRADYRAGETAFRRAIEIRPNAPWAHHYYALLLTMLGRFPQAQDEARRTLSIDPLSVPATATLGILMAHEGKLDAARAQLDRALQLSPNFIVALYYLGSMEAAQGNFQKAVKLLEKAFTIAPNFPGVRGALANTYERLGRTADAQRLIAQARSYAFAEGSRGDERMRLNYAIDLALVGQSDTALALLRTAQWDIPTLFDLRTDPLLQKLRSDSRYVDLLARFGLNP